MARSAAERRDGAPAGGNSVGEKTGESIEVGTFTYANGNVYEGEHKDGMPHGRGIIRFASGNVYDGDWKDDKAHGKGKFRFANGNVHEGEFKNGNQHGWGTSINVNGNTYEGSYVKGKRHGKGTLKFGNGDVYEGQWVGGTQHGKGTLKYASGEVYEGEFKEGKGHGKGAVKYPSGDIYEGVWTDGRRENKGTMKWANGDVQTGRFDHPGGCKLRSQRSQQHRLEADKKACEHCGQDDFRFKLRVCTGCNLALYCSIQCQKAASGSHRRICNIVSVLPSRESDRLVLEYDKMANDFDAGLRYGTKYMDNMKHLEINLEAMSKGDKSVKLSAKQLSSLLRSKRGALDSVFWFSNDCIQAGGGDGRIEHGFIWKELHDLKQLRLQHMRFDDVQSICDIIGQQKNTLLVLSLPYLGIEWHKAKCRRTLAQTVNSCKHLVKLTLSDCVLMDTDLKIMLNGLTNLRMLHLRRNTENSHEFTDNTCGLIARKCTGLQDLDLDNHNQLSVRGIRKIFEGCSHLRSFETTTRKLSCKDVQSLLDIAPQLLFLYLGDKTAISEDELSNIIEATSGRVVFQRSMDSLFEPDGLSRRTRENYQSQINVLIDNVRSRRRDPEVANEWEVDGDGVG